MQTICSRFHASCCFSAFSFLYLACFCLAFFRFWIFSVHAMRQIYRQALSSLLGWCHRCCPNAKRDKHTHTRTHLHTHRACLLGPTHAIQHPLRSRAELFCATMDRMRGLKLCWKCHRKIQHDNKGWHKFPPTSCCRCHMSDAMWQADPATAPATAPHSIHIHVPKMAIVDVVAVAVIANWSMCAGQVKVAPAPCALYLVPVGAAPASAPTPSPSASPATYTSLLYQLRSRRLRAKAQTLQAGKGGGGRQRHSAYLGICITRVVRSETTKWSNTFFNKLN